MLAVVNPGFEEQTTGWSRREDERDPPSVAVDRDVKHAGAASIRISHRHSRSYSSVSQVVPCRPDTDYVASAFVRAEDVRRQGIGVNLFIGDRHGFGVGPPIRVSLRSGTYDWTRVAVRFNSGTRDAISVHAYLHEASGTVWFDDVEVREAPPWPGPPRGPQRPSAPILGGTDVYDYESLRLDVPSLGWCFGGGTAGEGIAVAVLAPVMSQRESVELAQRFGCLALPAMTWKPDALGATQWAYGAIGREQALRQTRGVLGQPVSVILIGRQHWGSLGPELQSLILGKVRSGTGLLYVKGEGADLAQELGLEEPLAPDPADFCGLPLEATPLGEGRPGLTADSLVTGFRLGQGRVLLVDYAVAAEPVHHCLCPPTERWRGGFRHYDLYQSFLARAVRWCADRPSPVRLLAFEGPGRVTRGSPARVTCRVGAPDGTALQVAGLVWRLETPYADGAPFETPVTVAGGRFAVAVPTDLARGEYLVHLRLLQGGRTVDWGTGVLAVDSPSAIAGIELERDVVSPAESVQARVHVTGEEPRGRRLRAQVLDAEERVVSERTLGSVHPTQRVRLDVSASRTVGNRLRVWLELPQGGPLDVAERAFRVNLPFDPQDLHLLVWGHGRNTFTGDRLRRELRAWGAELADVGTGPWEPLQLDEAGRRQIALTLEEVVGSGMRPVPYICRIWSDTAAGDGTVRQPCLTDPGYRAALAEALRERAAICRLYCPAGYTLGDENYLAQGREVCRSETCLAALREELARRYRTIGDLNRAWGTGYGAFTEIVPAPSPELRPPAGLPEWVAWRRSMNRTFADVHEYAADVIRKEDPGARVGFDGALFDPLCMGYDWGLLGRRLTLLNVYLDAYD